MSIAAETVGPSTSDLDRWIEMAGENEFIDAKGPMTWDGGTAAASLAKDIAAFANSRDGGVLVIGKSENPDGSASLLGLTPEQAASFDTTAVAQWINSRFSPPIHLACYKASHGGRQFVLLSIREFDDIPVLCIKSFQDPLNPKGHLLREGTIYVRNQNAESKPISTCEELRALVGLATRKKSDELLTHFDAMLKGRSLTRITEAPAPFEVEIQRVRNELNYDPALPGWWFMVHPLEDVGERWQTTEELEQVVARSAVRLYEEFPGQTKGTFPMGWGIANDFYGDTWALSRHGLFCYWKEFRENKESAQSTGYRATDNERIPAGEWIEFTLSTRAMAEFFVFASRLVTAYRVGESFRLCIRCGPLRNRKLISAWNPRILMGYGDPEPCRATGFVFDQQFEVETLRAEWEPICAKALKQFIELFPCHRISIEKASKLIEGVRAREV